LTVDFRIVSVIQSRHLAGTTSSYTVAKVITRNTFYTNEPWRYSLHNMYLDHARRASLTHFLLILWTSSAISLLLRIVSLVGVISEILYLSLRPSVGGWEKTLSKDRGLTGCPGLGSRPASQSIMLFPEASNCCKLRYWGIISPSTAVGGSRIAERQRLAPLL